MNEAGKEPPMLNMSVTHNEVDDQIKRAHHLIDLCHKGGDVTSGVLIVSDGDDLFLHSLNANQLMLYKILCVAKAMMEDIIRGEIERTATGTDKKDMN